MWGAKKRLQEQLKAAERKVKEAEQEVRDVSDRCYEPRHCSVCGGKRWIGLTIDGPYSVHPPRWIPLGYGNHGTNKHGQTRYKCNCVGELKDKVETIFKKNQRDHYTTALTAIIADVSELLRFKYNVGTPDPSKPEWSDDLDQFDKQQGLTHKETLKES